MDKEAALQAEEALDFLDTYQYPKVKEAVQTLREAFQPIIEREKDKAIKKKHGIDWRYGWNPIVKVQQVIDAITNARVMYEQAASSLEKTQKVQQDFLHAIELLDLTEEEEINMIREMREVRKIRRDAKDQTEIMLPLYDLACKYEHITKEFNQALKEMQRIAEYKQNRKYNVREKTDLAERFEKLA